MRNPISTAVDSYEMTDIGKLTIGTMIAQVVVGALQEQTNHHEEQRIYREQRIDYEEQARQDMIHFFNELISGIEGNINSWHVWRGYDKYQRRNFIIECFYKADLGDLVPMLTREILDVQLPI